MKRSRDTGAGGDGQDAERESPAASEPRPGLVDRLVLFIVLAWTMAFTVSRAVRLPNEFAKAHWLLDYRFGFIRRAAVGSLVALIAHLTGTPVTQNAVHVLSAVVFGCFAVSMLIAIWLILNAHDFQSSSVMVALAFASSPFLVMAGHLLGYLDQALFVLALLSILLVRSERYWSAALVQAFAVLVHEGYVLTAFPAVCVAAFFRLRTTSIRTHLRAAPALLAPLLVLLAITVRGLFASHANDLRAQLQRHLDSFGFVPTRAGMVADFEVSTLLDFLRINAGSLVDRCFDQGMLASVGPTWLALVYLIHVTGRWRPMTFVSIMLTTACVCPLAQHAIAFDTARIWTQTLGVSLLVLLAIGRDGERMTIPYAAILAIPALVLNAFMKTRLYDGEVERFDRIWRFVGYAPAFAVAMRAAIQAGRKQDVGRNGPQDLEGVGGALR